ncbi:MAG: sigma-70 family RNA polymerase sigma factor [Candidatus Poribacteria bacterium]|nr:sigma-70 family RNA polymerase sigma factor [Candidatus Poribacteria bacterium]
MKKKDAELIQRTLDGDQSAFTALVEKYQKGVHSLAWQKIGDFHIAQEITQDAFLRAYQKLGTLKNHNLFSGWLYVIATRLCCEWLRKKRLPMQSLETVDSKEVDQVAYTRYVEEQRETDINEIRRELVRDLLKKLPESERTVMTLHYLGEMTCESISEFLGVSPNTIRSRLSRARNRLKKEETMIKENLSSFQLPTQMTENIMKEISRLNPVAPSGSKPLVPLAVSAASAVLVLLLMGLGTQRLSDFQKPFNLNAQSERTIEISEAQLVIDSPAKPSVRNQIGHVDLAGESNGVGQKPDDPLFAAANADETEVSKAKPQWVQTKGPEGGSVSGLFTTTRGDVYAGTRQGLYRLTDDGTAWKLINNMEGPSHVSLTIKSKWWPVVERQDTLYLATINHILASTDRGETWEALCESIEGPLVDMVITDGIPGAQSDMTIYLAYTNGIFRTDNGGKSWSSLSEGLNDREIREIAAIENTVFVGTDQGLLRLNDENWEHLPIGKPNKNSKTQAILDLAADEHHLYVVVGEEMKHQFGEGYTIMMLGDPGWLLYRSIDTGNSWDSIDPRTDGFEDKFRNRTPSVRITAMGEKILVTAGKDHFYSSDAGENWTLLDLGNLSDI